MKCQYEFRNKRRCQEEAHHNSNLCLLHIPFPDNACIDELERINLGKKALIESKINKNDFNFEGARLLDINLSGKRVIGNMNFMDSIVNKYACFNQIQIEGGADFDNISILGGEDLLDDKDFDIHLGFALSFMGAHIRKDLLLNDCCIRGNINLTGAQIGKWVHISNKAKIFGSCYFIGTNMGGYPSFIESEVVGDIFINESEFGSNKEINNAINYGFPIFEDCELNGELYIRNSKIGDPATQEKVFRKAKLIRENIGDSEEADYCYYFEMEAKRRQKPRYVRYPEYVFIQLIFGYGVHPLRLWACWFGFVGIFAILYFLGQGIDPVASQLKGNATVVDYIWFSIATAVTPGYAGYNPTTDFKLVAGLEAIFGTFVWAAFIATFARKYMR